MFVVWCRFRGDRSPSVGRCPSQFLKQLSRCPVPIRASARNARSLACHGPPGHEIVKQTEMTTFSEFAFPSSSFIAPLPFPPPCKRLRVPLHYVGRLCLVRDSYKSSSEKCLTNERKKERYFGRNCWYLKSGRSRVVLEARCNCNDSCRSGIAAICKRTGGLFPRFRKHRPICRFSPNPLPTLSPVGGSVHH